MRAVKILLVLSLAGNLVLVWALIDKRYPGTDLLFGQSAANNQFKNTQTIAKDSHSGGDEAGATSDSESRNLGAHSIASLVSRIKELLGSSPTAQSTRRVDELLKELGQLDHDAAFAVIRDLPPLLRAARENAVLAGWVVSDPPGAWSWIGIHPQPSGWLGAISDESRYVMLADSLLNSDKPNDLYTILVPLKELPSGVVQRLGDYLGNFDIASGVAKLRSLPDGNLKLMLTVSLLTAVARDEPATAIGLALSLPSSDSNGSGRPAGIPAAFGEAALTASPSDLANWLHEPMSEQERINSIRQAVPVLALRDPTAANTIAQELQPDDLRKTLLDQTTLRLRAFSFAQAVSWVALAYPPGIDRQRQLENTTRSWLQRPDGAQAAQIIQELPTLSPDERTWLGSLAATRKQ